MIIQGFLLGSNGDLLKTQNSLNLSSKRPFYPMVVLEGMDGKLWFISLIRLNPDGLPIYLMLLGLRENSK